MTTSTDSPSFLRRHEFLIRRLHSLTGLIPVGAFMTVHLLVNASLLDGASLYQRNVYQIHSLEGLLPVVEWGFIFLPILFHGIFGLIILLDMQWNTGSYPYPNNYRYVLQRVTGVIALVFILAHVFHMHGWFHFAAWRQYVVAPLGGAQFRPFNAASTLAMTFHGVVIPALYLVGVMSCVYHLANGIWTMGITWGLWISPAAQRRATVLATLIGVVLAVVGFGAWIAPKRVNIPEAREAEDAMYKAMTEARLIQPNPEKRYEPREQNESDGGQRGAAAASH